MWRWFQKLNNPEDPSFYEGEARVAEAAQRYIGRMYHNGGAGQEIDSLLQPYYDDILDAGGGYSMDRLKAYYEQRMAEAVRIIKDAADWHYRHKWNNVPEIVLNLVAHGPVERGIDM
ncbi:MAG: hypothetical protein LBH26_04805 [Treponema sp.]|jgi:hypothetical protein|nr:hypothetical protein [Treponema sp.]